MEPLAALGPGLIHGGIAALCGPTLLALVEAIWIRQPRPVAAAAVLGAGTADLVLIAIGAWLGAAVGSLIGDDGLRSTLAIGLLAGLAARILLGLLLGTPGIPGRAVLPDRPAIAWGQVAAIALLALRPGIVAAAAALANPAIGAGLPVFAASMVAGATGLRLAWAATGRNRVGVRAARPTYLGIGISAILLLALLAVRALPG